MIGQKEVFEDLYSGKQIPSIFIFVGDKSDYWDMKDTIFTEQNRPKPNDLSFLKDQVVQLIHFKNASDEFFFTWYTYLSTIGIKTLVATDSEVETYVSRH
jgi:hypothetical protein